MRRPKPSEIDKLLRPPFGQRHPYWTALLMVLSVVLVLGPIAIGIVWNVGLFKTPDPLKFEQNIGGTKIRRD